MNNSNNINNINNNINNEEEEKEIDLNNNNNIERNPFRITMKLKNLILSQTVTKLLHYQRVAFLNSQNLHDLKDSLTRIHQPTKSCSKLSMNNTSKTGTTPQTTSAIILAYIAVRNALLRSTL